MKVFGIDRAAFNQGANAMYDFQITEDKCMTLVAKGPSAVGIIYDLPNNSRSFVFRRLQGSKQTICTSRQVSLRRERERENVVEYVVRRLTPKECERLQGFPDDWTDIGAWTDSKGKLHKESSDASRYKALGNSIATGPNSFWKFLIKRISAQYDREVTMGSLFDGIGGFPLVHEQINGKGSCKWASEIEEFCIAVTKKHFPEE